MNEKKIKDLFTVAQYEDHATGSKSFAVHHDDNGLENEEVAQACMAILSGIIALHPTMERRKEALSYIMEQIQRSSEFNSKHSELVQTQQSKVSWEI